MSPSAVGVDILKVVAPPAPVGTYWGVYYDRTAQQLQCWLYAADGSFMEVVDTQDADLNGTRNSGTWKAECSPMAINGDAIQWPYSIDVSPFTRSGFHWLPESGEITQHGSTIDPDSESSSDFHGRHSNVRSGVRFFLGQLSSFDTNGDLSWTGVTSSGSLRGKKEITMPSFSDSLAFDTGFSAGWIPIGDSIVMEIGNHSTGDITGLLVIDTETKVATLHQPFTDGVGTFPGSSAMTFATWSGGIDMGGGRGLFLRKLSGGGWVAVTRGSDGGLDVQHWQDTGLSSALTTAGAPKVSRVGSTSEIVAYPLSTNTLIRTDVGDGAGVDPSENSISVETGPNGEHPQVMLPRS